jgi:hypothetical protein
VVQTAGRNLKRDIGAAREVGGSCQTLAVSGKDHLTIVSLTETREAGDIGKAR